MLFVNQFGRVVDITDDELIARYNKSKTMRPANELEIDKYREHNQQRALRDEPTSINSIYFSTVSNTPDGYGMSQLLLKTELAKKDIILSENYVGQKVGLLYSYPYSILQMRTDVRLIFTMFESDKIPDEWVDYLNEADEVIVPSHWCQKIFAKAGVKTTVVPLGYNHRVFKYIDRPEPNVFTFLHYNSFNIRKGFQQVFQAFTEEFKKDEPVKLILKTVQENSVLPILKSQYPNIEVIRGTVSEQGLTDILGRSNCLVYPSMGEGFGITPLEAMATGMPAIIPNEHGISEYFNSDICLEVKAPGRSPALYNRFRGQNVGEMVVADVDDLKRQMRWAYNHQKEIKELGQAASRYVQKFTIEKTAENLKVVLDKWQDSDVPKRTESPFLKVVAI